MYAKYKNINKACPSAPPKWLEIFLGGSGWLGSDPSKPVAASQRVSSGSSDVPWTGTAGPSDAPATAGHEQNQRIDDAYLTIKNG